ncbi:MAG: putative rane protein [Xanthobacteraceae bacterium]|jgi:hypothetical protein|nr:putative rane protein [Xanthobacteraceae bacterium]
MPGHLYTTIELSGIAAILVLTFLLNLLLRKRLGRYLRFVVANLLCVLIVSSIIYLSPLTSHKNTYIEVVLGFLVPQLAFLLLGLFWLRLNAFKLAIPRGSAMKAPHASPLPSGRIEPAFAASSDAAAAAVNGASTQDPANTIHDDPPADEVNRNFFKRYWRGEFSLPFSFWVVGILVGVAAALIVLALNTIFDVSGDYNPYSLFGFLVSLWAIVILATIWQTVGLWRSATHHMHERWRRGRHTFWGGLVKLLLVFSVLASTMQLVQSAFPQIRETYSIAFRGDPDLPDYSLRVMRNGTEIEIVGGFKYGLATDLDRVLRASPQIAVVHLDSIGGRIGEAMKVHDIIRQRRLITYVAARCYSACTLAFAGGGERWLGGAGKLGFHAPDFPGMGPAELSSAVVDQQELLADNGFDPRFIARALSTPATSLWIPTTQELFAGRAVTDLATPAKFAISGFGADLDLAGAAANVKIISPSIAAIEERDPATAQAIYRQFRQMYLAGNSVAEVVLALQDALDTEFLKYRRMADDKSTIAFGQLAIDQIEQIARLDTLVCYEHLSGVGNANLTNYLTPELIKREAELVAAMIRTAAPRKPTEKAIVEAGMKNIMATLQAGPQRKNLVLYSRTPTPQQYGDFCALIAATYRAALTQPPVTAAALIRRLIFDQAE